MDAFTQYANVIVPFIVSLIVGIAILFVYREKVERHNPQTSYDVQELSKQVIEELKADTRINPLKEYLFKEGLGLDDLAVVFGIYLRDKILVAKGWKVEDIDKYDPNNPTS